MIDALDLTLERLSNERSPTRVATTTVLPSGAVISVLVRSTANGTYSVSDDGSGRDDLVSLGVQIGPGDKRRANEIASRLGLSWEGEQFAVQGVTADQLASAIIYVAEATRAWACASSENASRRTERTLVARTQERIREAVPSVKMAREVELMGASSKRHRFDLVIELGSDRKAIFEMVTPNANSLSSAHLKLFDLQQAHAAWPREAITERFDEWASPDINLLAAVATHVRDVQSRWSDLPALLH